MQEPLPPPVPEPIVQSRARWRWGIHLLLLSAYPLTLGLLGALNQGDNSTPMLPSGVGPLLAALAAETVVFCVVFGLAVAFSRANLDELFLKWNSYLRPVIRGFFYSIGLRLLLFLVVFAIAAAAGIATGGGGEIANKLRPQTEQVVDAKALAENPAYFVLNLTLVSFVFAGFREELWRAGMLAAFNALWPTTFKTPPGRWLVVGLTALVFGLGHLPQGWGGVLLTGTLGFGLGIIMLRHRSIWEAAMAHGFFNAATFAMLYAMVRFNPKWMQTIGRF